MHYIKNRSKKKFSFVLLNFIAKSQMYLFALKPQSKRVTRLNINFTISIISSLAVCVVRTSIQTAWTRTAHHLGETQVPLSRLFTSFPLTQRRAAEKLHSSPQYFTPSCGEGLGASGAFDFLRQDIKKHQTSCPISTAN